MLHTYYHILDIYWAVHTSQYCLFLVSWQLEVTKNYRTFIELDWKSGNYQGNKRRPHRENKSIFLDLIKRRWNNLRKWPLIDRLTRKKNNFSLFTWRRFGRPIWFINQKSKVFFYFILHYNLIYEGNIKI